MFDKIQILQKKGYVPNAILDIGAYKGFWTEQMHPIYKNSEYYLFEAINYTDLDRYKTVPNIHVYKNVLLNDKIEVVDWYEKQNTGDSFFKEKTHLFTSCKPTKKFTIDLDTFIKQKNILQNINHILIKIDCQWAEINILNGAKSLLPNTGFIILEMPLFGQYNEGVPNFLSHIQFMDSVGFVPYDIVDNHYINDFNMQVDILFINKNHEFNTIVHDLLL